MNYPIPMLMVVWLAAISFCCQKEEPETIEPEALTIQYARLGTESILHGSPVSPKGPIVIGFSKPVEEQAGDFFQLSQESESVMIAESWSADRQEITMTLSEAWAEGGNYRLIISPDLRATDGARFPGDTLFFSTSIEPLTLSVQTKNGVVLLSGNLNTGIPLSPEFELRFSHVVSEDIVREHMEWSGGGTESIHLTPRTDSSFTATISHPLEYYASYEISFSENLADATGRPFDERTFELFTT